MKDGQIVFVNLPVPYFLVDDAQSFGVFCGQDDAAGVPVNAVAQCGDKGVLVPGAPLFGLIEVGLDMGDEGVDLLMLDRKSVV